MNDVCLFVIFCFTYIMFLNNNFETQFRKLPKKEFCFLSATSFNQEKLFQQITSIVIKLGKVSKYKMDIK